jgi:hypothetical protein
MDKIDTIFISMFMFLGGIVLILAAIFKNKAILTILSIRSLSYWIGKIDKKEPEYTKLDQFMFTLFGVLLVILGAAIFLNIITK